MKTVVKIRRAGQGPAKQLKTAKTSEESSSTSDERKTGQDAVMSGLGRATLPQKPPNRRKMSLKKSLQERAKSSETTHDKPHSYELLSEHELLKVESLTSFLLYASKIWSFILLIPFFRRRFQLVCHIHWHVDGAYMNGSTVLLIIHGLQRWILLII